MSGKLIRIIHVPFTKMSTCKTTPSKTISFCFQKTGIAHQPLTFLAIERVTRRVQNKHKTSLSLHLPQPKAMLMSYQLPERKWLSYDNIIQYHWEVLNLNGQHFQTPYYCGDRARTIKSNARDNPGLDCGWSYSSL